ncbi:hypothetical protein ILYODFUR_034779 [Ilyodon furcidens]|uniref:Uncharacterized protein n=1 Tax=Ilyodon furcidens TaxID=33524 RepID=A0ABV0TDY0_9TELE
MMLFKKMDDQSFFKTSFAFTEQDDGNQECKVKCPKCKTMFWLSIELLKVIDKTQCRIKVSITTRKIENQGDKQSGL